MPPRPHAAAAVLTLALAGTAAAQGNPANPYFPDAVGGPAVLPAQAVGPMPAPGGAFPVGPPPGGPMPGGPMPMPGGPMPIGEHAWSPDGVGDHAAPWGPTCWFGAEYLLWWTRHAPVNQRLANFGPGIGMGITGTPFTSPALGGEGISFNSASGLRVLGGVWLTQSQTLGVEADFFILPTKRVDSPSIFATDQNPTLARPFFDVSTNAQNSRVLSRPGFFTGGIADSAETLLWGAEVLTSVRLWDKHWVRADGLIGFQFLDLDESLQINDFATTLAGGTATFLGTAFRRPSMTFVEDRFTTQNHFYGGVVGTRLSAQVQAFTLAVTGKVGLGTMYEAVTANGSTTLTGPFPAPVVTGGGFLAAGANTGRFRRTEFTYVPELGVNLTVQITPHWTVKGGYTYLYIDNVARPGNQLPASLNPTQIPTSQNFGAVFTGRQAPFEIVSSPYFAHGLNFGVLYAF
jgi:hypothetical protein